MQEFKEMVTRLRKPGADILAQMTPEKADLLHMAIGVAGELSELDSAIESQDDINVLEELGDIEFYMEGIRQIVGLTRECLDDDNDMYTAPDAGGILDVVKKHCFYNKELDLDILREEMIKVEWRLLLERRDYSYTRGFTLSKNIEKLDKGRYKNGYSDQAAQDRADKQEGE